MIGYRISTRQKQVIVGIIVGIAGFCIIGRIWAIHRLAVTPVEILRASGGEVQYNVAAAEWGVKGKPIWAALSPYHTGLGFLGLNTEQAIIYYIPGKNVYRIVGEVKVCYPNDATAVVANTDIKGPGLRQHPAGDRWSELARCQCKQRD